MPRKTSGPWFLVFALSGLSLGLEELMSADLKLYSDAELAGVRDLRSTKRSDEQTLQLARHAFFGVGMPGNAPDLDEVIKLLKSSSFNKNVDAQILLGQTWMLRAQEEQRDSTRTSYYKYAADALQNAAEAGSRDAHFMLARLIESGAGQNSKLSPADFYDAEAARLGHPAATVRFAKLNYSARSGVREALDRLEQIGIKTPSSHEATVKNLEFAANNGNLDGLDTLIDMAKYGHGFDTKDYVAAFKWAFVAQWAGQDKSDDLERIRRDWRSRGPANAESQGYAEAQKFIQTYLLRR